MLPTGYEVEPARPEMVPELTDLIGRYDTRNGAPKDFGEEDLREIFREQHFDIDKDTWVVRTDGAPVAFGMLWQRSKGTRVVAVGVVDPQHWGRGLGSFLIDRFEERCRGIQAEAGLELKLHLYLEKDDEAANALARRKGFDDVRGNYTMFIEFDGEIRDPEIPEGISVRTCTAEDSRLCYELVEETFEDAWERTPRTWEEWEKGLIARDDFDPSLWWVAFEDDEPAAMLLGYELEGMGWVADLGVRRQFRKRGIAAALLRLAFREFQKRGYSKVGLGVDAQNHTGAVALYERVGMKVGRSYTTYEKTYA